MKHLHEVHDLVNRVTDLAFTASGALVPQPFRGVLDRTLVDVACASSGGVVPVATALQVDPPAVDAWRSVGVPHEFRGRLTRMAMLLPTPQRCAA